MSNSGSEYGKRANLMDALWRYRNILGLTLIVALGLGACSPEPCEAQQTGGGVSTLNCQPGSGLESFDIVASPWPTQLSSMATSTMAMATEVLLGSTPEVFVSVEATPTLKPGGEIGVNQEPMIDFTIQDVEGLSSKDDGDNYSRYVIKSANGQLVSIYVPNGEVLDPDLVARLLGNTNIVNPEDIGQVGKQVYSKMSGNYPYDGNEVGFTTVLQQKLAEMGGDGAAFMYQKMSGTQIEGLTNEFQSYAVYEARQINLQTAQEQSEAQARIIDRLVVLFGEAGIDTSSLKVVGFGSAHEGLGVRKFSDLDVLIVKQFVFGESAAEMVRINEVMNSPQFMQAIALASGILDMGIAEHINLVLQGQSMTGPTQAIIETIPLDSSQLIEEMNEPVRYFSNDSFGG